MLKPSELDHLNRQVLALVGYIARRGQSHLEHRPSGRPLTGHKWRGKRVLHRAMALVRRCRHPTLARPLDRPSDRDIDAALGRAGLTRADLFTPAGAIARHRVYMAYMLAAHHVDIARATADRWQDLKFANRSCAACRQKGRCRRWVEGGGPADATSVFCPNAALFQAIAAQQAKETEIMGSTLTDGIEPTFKFGAS